ncbi:helix-turn-helix domain-containing protein [Mameliella alba]|nr:helix-turn-helix domain-containing protein [Mameliella alba]MBY6171542.1 helix-turn-helix domain-containing protein [Mameliella alba]MBY6176767.1 helix-turn-helix domain-containing protein [Mameliella alba]
MNVHVSEKLLEQTGAAIRRQRLAEGLGLKELARLSGLSISALSLIETGKRDPRLSTLDRIAKSLGTEVSTFFKDPEDDELKARNSGPGYDLSEFE